jgi:hypothetical protein
LEYNIHQKRYCRSSSFFQTKQIQLKIFKFSFRYEKFT